MRSSWIPMITLGLAALAACTSAPMRQLASDAPTSARLRATLVPEAVAQGSLVRVQLHLEVQAGEALPPLRVVFDGRAQPFFAVGPVEYEAWLGIPVDQPIGPAVVTVEVGTGPDTPSIRLPLAVSGGDYGIQRLQVDPARVKLSARNQERVDRESAETRQLYAIQTPERLFSLPFVDPIHPVVTAPFGATRVFNRQPRGFHTGVDLRAPAGRAIHAASRGRVVLARELFISGNTVIIDHGLGIYTAYGHLKSYDVEPGDEVQAGEVIGRSGSTGRVTGPHLHWAVSAGGVFVNPLELLSFHAAP